MKILFIGNSATYVHEIPETLARLANEQGCDVETESITRGGYMLSQYAEEQGVYDTIKKGFDIVVFQDNGNCISSDEMREKCRSALEKLIKAAKESGANAYIYVRPPYGYSSFGYTPLEQCDEFDKLFLEISEKEGAENIYVNRAFAEAIKTTDLKLWGPDNAHTSEQGAYLAVCIFFATIFKKSATILDTNGLPENEVDEIKKIADKISSEVKR
jgi:uncharacterized protein YbjQ (UPF0145 family)